MADLIIVGIVVLGIFLVVFKRIRHSKINKGKSCDGNCSSCSYRN